jgi:hypothetical protein
MCFYGFFGMIIRFIISETCKLPDPKKIHAIVNMHVPHNSLQIQIFNSMAQFYRCFINNFAMIMAPITKLLKILFFLKDRGMFKNLGAYKVKIYQNIDFNTMNWDVEFHVHMDAPLLAMGALLAQNIIGKNDQTSNVCFQTS